MRETRLVAMALAVTGLVVAAGAQPAHAEAVVPPTLLASGDAKFPGIARNEADSSAAPLDAPHPLSLADAVRIASGETPAVEIAALKTREAEARLAQARGVLLPSLSGSASASNRTFSFRALGIEFPSIPGAPPIPDRVGPVDNVDARLKVTQSLIDPSGWAKIGAAGDAVKSAQADRDASAEASAEAGALAYLRALKAQAVVDARRRDAELATQLLALAEAQQKAGVAPGIDVTRARTQVVSAESQRLVAVNLLDRAQIDLARALGLDPATRFALADTLSGSFGALGVPSDPEAAVTAALGGRPELRAESLKQRRARSDRLAIRAERLPRIEAAADYGLSGADGPDAIATRQFSVALTLPLIDGFRREARLAEQGAVIREAEVRERDLRDEIAAEVKAALLDLASGLDQQNVAAERITLAQEEVAQATDRFRNGVTGNIEVIDAQSSLVRARDAQIDARAATAVARIELARAAGQARTLR